MIKKRVKRPPKTSIPNSFTVLSMLFGFTAIVSALDGQLNNAVWLIYVAAFFDLIDGRIAKLLKATSDFGAEIDTLADLVTFGMAPAVIIYQAYFVDWGLPGIFIAFSHLGFSALRLARFNMDNYKRIYFQGVPTPVAALTVAGFVAFAHRVWGDYIHQGIAATVVMGTALLMVSNIDFESNVIENRRKFSQTWKIIPFTLSVICVAIFGLAAIFPWMLFYISVGFARWTVREVLERINSDDLPEPLTGEVIEPA